MINNPDKHALKFGTVAACLCSSLPSDLILKSRPEKLSYANIGSGSGEGSQLNQDLEDSAGRAESRQPINNVISSSSHHRHPRHMFVSH